MADLETLAFDPANAKAALAQLPTTSAVFALYGAEAHAEPYIGRTPNLRGRLERLLQPSAKHPRRLQLAGRVRQIRWWLTASEFESLLAQFHLLEAIYGPKSLVRMHLGAPAFIRYLGSNAYPRITVTNRPSQREAQWAYGPFKSRAAAERFADEALKLFLLRRCTEELAPHPSHPGCVYSEMKMCLAPCYQGCTDERYDEEATAVQQFLATRGDSSLVALRTQRDEASANLEFEAAAALHSQAVRVESVRALASELVRPLSQLRAVILQASAIPGQVAVFLYENGRLGGPAAFSTFGMRIQNEQSGSTSLFAHPMAIEAIPEAAGKRDQGTGNREQGTGNRVDENESTSARNSLKATDLSPYSNASEETRAFQASEEFDKGQKSSGHDFSCAITDAILAGALAPEGSSSEAPPPLSEAPPARLARGTLEARMEAALASLSNRSQPPSPTLRQGHLALLKRWHYRPEARRAGEIFFPGPAGQWPIKALLRGAGRIAAKMLASAATQS